MTDVPSAVPPRPTLTVKLRIDGVSETLRAFRGLGPDANRAIRVAAMTLSQRLAAAISAAGRAEGRQAALLVRTVKARRDRLPVVSVGGATPQVGRPYPGRGRAKPWELLFGSEFGNSWGHGFRPHRGRRGYWIHPTVDREAPTISREWTAAADRVLAQFAAGR